MIAFILLVVGGLNWLAVGFGMNVVEKIVGSGNTVSMVIYILVGLSAIFELVTHKSNCKCCAGGSMDKGMSGGMDPMKQM